MNTPTCFGVDLGTTNSAAGIVKNGQIVMVVDKSGKQLVPSYVCFPPNGRPPMIVGNPARNLLRNKPTGVIFDCKRLIGMKYTDPIVNTMRQYSPFDIVDDGNGKPQIAVIQDGKERRQYPEEIGAFVLEQLRENAGRLAGNDSIKDVVITVPAYFNQKQRQATKDAGVLAGLNVLEIISEPVAAAYAYADTNNLDQDGKEKTIMIYDLGGGTFDVTIMSVKGSQYKEIGLDGDLFLGGSDFDLKLMNHVISIYKRNGGCDLNAKKLGKLRFKCEELKTSFISLQSGEIAIDDDDDDPIEITRATLEYLLKPEIQKTLDICDRVIKTCGKTIDDIDDIILVGGSSRLHIVHTMLEEHFHKKLHENINPDECVAYGATKYAYSITTGLIDQHSKMKPVEVEVTCPSDIGVRNGDKMYVMIKRGQTLPCSSSVLFANSTDYAQEASISVYQGNSPLVVENMLLREIRVRITKPLPRGQNTFLLRLEMDKKGSLSAFVQDQLTKAEGRINNIQQYYTEDEMGKMTDRVKEVQKKKDEYERLVKMINDYQQYCQGLMANTTDPVRRQQLVEISNGLSQCKSLDELVPYYHALTGN